MNILVRQSGWCATPVCRLFTSAVRSSRAKAAIGSSRIASLTLAVAIVLLLAGPTPSARAAMIVVPNAQESTEGNFLMTFPFYSTSTTGMRYQQVYASSQFSSLGGPGTITEMRFRLDASGVAFSETISSIDIRLSTTSKSPDGLSTTFASNPGLDDTLVYSGALTLSSSSSGPGPRPFDIVIALQNSFTYDPSQGNLLLDVKNLDTSTTLHLFDAQGTGGDSVSMLYALGSSATIGSPDTRGLVTQFNFSSAAAVPEPSTFALLAIGVAGLAGFGLRRWKQRKA